MPPPLQPTLLVLVGGGILTLVLMRSLRPVLERRALASEDHALVDRPQSLRPAILRWGAAGLLCIAALTAADRRGIELNWIDVQYPIPRAARSITGGVPRSLQALRARARRGEASLDEYRERRRALSRGGK
jgi:hypothetical protein